MLGYRRDGAVRRYLHAQGIPFHELPGTGVVRRLRNRDNWGHIWEDRMAQAQASTPKALRPLGLEPGPIPDHAKLGLPPDLRTERQPGGEAEGQAVLHSFLTRRGRGYGRAISSPNTAWTGCSRLSPHLAWGTLSLRQVVQATRCRIARADPGWAWSLSSFESRLHWRDHFIQKLEDQPDLEQRNLLRSLDGLREPYFDSERFAAWAEGRTGYPLVDACMRALIATGWLNFRMRAMLMSFASYDLSLPWDQPALHLAGLFADYEPGIHYPQVQMQSGSSGINTLRVYNPTRQAQELDPEGCFIRCWVPELAGVPTGYIHTPWVMPPLEQLLSGFRPSHNYPLPLVNHAQASRAALDKLYKARQTPQAKAEIAGILKSHTSRQTRPHRNEVEIPF